MQDQPPAIDALRTRLFEGLVIPAHPLALTDAGVFDDTHQRGLTRYYLGAGAGGIAVGVHTTQFAIREPKHGLLQPVLELAAETAVECDAKSGRSTVKIAGVCGATPQAVAEAELARRLGYDAGLLSLGALRDAPDDELIVHARAVAQVLPLFGFYLQPAAGGRLLSPEFWRRFAEIPEVVAVKIAPFNRYQTLDVVRAVAESGRANEIALYTGNDDNIVIDLLTEFHFNPKGSVLTIDNSASKGSVPGIDYSTAKGSVPGIDYSTAGSVGNTPGVANTRDRLLGRDRPLGVKLHFSGGLLGHWACWTRSAVELLEECKRARARGAVPGALLTRAAEVTEMNAALFDAVNGFAGCIPGIHHVLKQQGLLASTRCLNPAEVLSPGQAEAIDRLHHQGVGSHY